MEDSKETKNKIENTFERVLIYIISINYDTHKGLLKIGKATIKSDKPNEKLLPNCKELNVAARKRINSYTQTAGIKYDLHWTELAVREEKNENGNVETKCFFDTDVHDVLKHSNFDKVKINKTSGIEWYQVDLETAKNAIKACKENRKSLYGTEISHNEPPISFRPEQLRAINQTISHFKNNNHILWNAKMRFGKTISALQVVKEEGFAKTIIATHRPVVDDGWHKDFNKIFNDKDDYVYVAKNSNINIKELIKSNTKFIYFASIQDLRGSKLVGGKFNKNDDIFKTNWDCVIIDEAHEGTTTKLGLDVKENLQKENTKVIELSGTPFNIINKYKEDEIFTWDYIMEQKAKDEWDSENFGDTNPYDDLPKMNIYTYDLGEQLGFEEYEELETKAFNFKEFFRVWEEKDFEENQEIQSDAEIGDFVHKNDIKKFLNLITQENNNSHYPYSSNEYREFFKHSLWIIPGVKEAKALHKLMDEHPIFGNKNFFRIINVAGNGDDFGKDDFDDKKNEEALKKVKNAIKEALKTDSYTITLSCGRLTTGVTVPEWTAVMMLAGSFSTSASRYMQTIFRVQSPANINGKIKQNGYVFDFAPDRTLKMIADAVKLSTKAGKTSNDDRERLGKFLNFCPVLSLNGTEMIPYKTDTLLQQLKKAYVDRVVRSGFEDYNLYNENLYKLTKIELEKFDKMKKIIGSSNNTTKIKDIPINEQGFTDEEYERIRQIEAKPKKERTPEEEAFLAEQKEKKAQRERAISILRAISIRMPLLVYGGEFNKENIQIEDLLNEKIVDEESWKEFMPTGVKQENFQDFIQYYDKDVFSAASKKIRDKVKYADTLFPTERAVEITKILACFKNPDKETVLTPWKVVNMHLGDTLGGFNFYDKKYENQIEEPRFIDRGEATKDTVANKRAQILEINSKSGLYPLYATYSIFRSKCPDIKNTSFKEQERLWNETVQNNIYVICKTPMAKSITKRTLIGFKKGIKVNARYIDKLLDKIKNKPQKFIEKIKQSSYWKKRGNVEINFDAIIGNPPYQGKNHQQIYPDFYIIARELGKYVSLIFPIGWQEPKNANNLSKLNNPTVKADEQIIFIDNKQNVFPGIAGAEWTNVLLWKKGYDNGLNGLQVVLTNGENPERKKLLWEGNQITKPQEIVDLANLITKQDNFKSIETITSNSRPYGIRTDVFKNYKKYGLEEMYKEKSSKSDIKIYSSNNQIRYVPKNYKLPKKTNAINKYKIFVPYAWGNMNEKAGLGGAFADIIIGFPNEITTETYLESGCFDDYSTAQKHAKYLMTKFLRALLYMNKTSQHSTTSWGAIPLQSYKESWWNKSIAEIDDKLMEKYNVPEKIRKFINANIQTKNETNIINYKS